MKKSFILIITLFVVIISAVVFNITVFADGEYKIEMLEVYYGEGSDITFKFSGSKSAGDWVGICKADVKDYKTDNFDIWIYLSTGKKGSVAPTGEIVESGERTLKPILADGAVLPVGEYSLVYMSNDSYEEVFRCNFEISAKPDTSKLPQVYDVVMSDDNSDLSFSLPDECSAGKGYSFEIYWADIDKKNIADKPFYSYEIKENKSVSIEIKGLESIPENAENINIYICRYGYRADSGVSVQLNKKFVQLVIPEDERMINTNVVNEANGDKLYNALKSVSIWVVGAIALCFLTFAVGAKFRTKRDDNT